MAVLFDPAEEYVRLILELAKVRGEISLADLESITEAGIEARDSISTEDIGDTIDALADMGIEIDDGLTEEQKDAEFYEGMKDWVACGNMLPQLTGEGWMRLGRAIERKKAAGDAPPDPEKSPRKRL